MGLNSTVGPSQDPIVDRNDDVPSSASFWQQLKATVIRNYYRKLRNKRQAFRVSQYFFIHSTSTYSN